LSTYSIVFLAVLSLFISCSQATRKPQVLAPVADFEEQETMFLCWNPAFEDIILRLTKVIGTNDHITIFYNEANHEPKKIRNLLQGRKVKLSNVSLVPFRLKYDNIWIRDYGPVFLCDQDGNTQILSFEYPHKVNKDYSYFSEDFSSKLKIPFLRSKMLSAGGGREINGKGTMILVESYEKFINPRLSLQEIEYEYKQKLNQTNIIWLKRGIPQDDEFDNGPVLDNIYGNGVNGHIDEFCRFADASTILLAEVDTADFEQDEFYRVIHERLEESYRILLAAKDQDGKPFEIIRVPQAPVFFTEAKYKNEDIYYVPVTSYLNFVITNNSVVIPSYYKIGDPEFVKKREIKIKKIFQEIYPSRKIIMINAMKLNYAGGGLHCVTLPKPKQKRKRYLNIFKTRKLG